MLAEERNKVAIMGCGWLGFPLAKHLIKLNYMVKGSTTSEDKLDELANHHIVPYKIHLQPDKTSQQINDFLDVDLLIINVPPGRNQEKADSYLENMEYLKGEILNSGVKKIIFISSTSVYHDNQQVHTEESVELSALPSGKRMLASENIFKNLSPIQTTIIRMAGLIGPNRHPGRFFAGKTAIPNGLSPVNLIHLEDCIGIIVDVIKNNRWDEIFNAAAPTHPTKSEFYNLASQQLYQQNAVFIAEKGSFKIINADKISDLGYSFKHPDLMQWLLENHPN